MGAINAGVCEQLVKDDITATFPTHAFVSLLGSYERMIALKEPHVTSEVGLYYKLRVQLAHRLKASGPIY
jgi:hypothetical protein